MSNPAKSRSSTAVTLVPLTPPSTHLVEITLDLVVLVDRLLTTLRHRYELLELTSLRLQWDTLRWKALQEGQSIMTDLERALQEHGRWTQPKLSTSGDLARTVIPDVGSTVHSPPQTSARGSPIATRPITAPRRSGPVHMLPTQLRNLSSRQKTLSATLVARASTTLDKMIDRAAALRGLGGIEGSDDEEDNGAVPEALLDIQDDLETQSERLQQDIRKGRAVQDNWEW